MKAKLKFTLSCVFLWVSSGIVFSQSPVWNNSSEVLCGVAVSTNVALNADGEENTSARETVQGETEENTGSQDRSRQKNNGMLFVCVFPGLCVIKKTAR